MHQSVLLEEIIGGLQVAPGDFVLDATVNGGGHSLAICERYRNITLIGIDADREALARARSKLSRCAAHLWEGNFRNLDTALRSFGISSVNRVLFDLGLSSDQLEHSGRGFSFQKDEPLLMTFSADPKPGELTASEIVNRFPEGELKQMLYDYGEERFAPKIAKVILAAREKATIKSSAELANIVSRAVPPFYRRGRTHPATKTFQALRIAVNDELNALSEALGKSFERLTSEGRMAVISFHSLEDRIVKIFMKERALAGETRLINKKPIIPSAEEIECNPRSRSAKLRIIEKV